MFTHLLSAECVQGPPVSGAQVFLGRHHAAVTDSHGRFQLLNITTGAYMLKVRMFGSQGFDSEAYCTILCVYVLD